MELISTMWKNRRGMMTAEEARERSELIIAMLRHCAHTARLNGKRFAVCRCEWCEMVSVDEGISDDDLEVAWQMFQF
jgi:hypothetical protein